MRAVRKPVRWLPPSMVLMQLAKLKVDSVKPSLYWMAASTMVPLTGSLDVDGLRVDDVAVLVQVAHEAGDAALEVEVHLAVAALVEEADPDALGQVGHLAEALGQVSKS